MVDFESMKPRLARDISVAQTKQDGKAVTALCYKLNRLSKLSYNPFKPSAYLGYENDDITPLLWDVELWYYENRKKLYGILA